MSTKIAKGKPRQEKPRLKVMHLIKKDENGNASITSRTVPKLKEAVGPDVQQAAEETGHKVPKAKVEKPKDELSDEQRSILKALETLGGKDVHSMDIAKKLGFDKKFPKAPRAPVRNAMDKLHDLHFVTSKKAGVKYSYSITDKGKAFLEGKDKTGKGHDPDDVPDYMLNEAARRKRKMGMSGSELQQAIENETREEAAGLEPASNPFTSERPVSTDIECPKCHTFNPFYAIHCKQCGTQLKAEQAVSTVPAK